MQQGKVVPVNSLNELVPWTSWRELVAQHELTSQPFGMDWISIGPAAQARNQDFLRRGLGLPPFGTGSAGNQNQNARESMQVATGK